MVLAFLAPDRSRRFAQPGGRADDLASAVQVEEAKLQRAFLAAVSDMRRLFDAAGAGAGVSDVLIADVVREFERAFSDSAIEPLAAAFVHGAEYGQARLAVAGAGFAFGLVNERAVEWASVHGTAMFPEIADETRSAIRTIVARALRDGRMPAEVTGEIRNLLGLDEREAGAVDRLRRRLIGDGRTAEQIERITTRYANRLLRYRAETIARTEVLSAANRGQEALWAEAVRQGLLTESAWERMWLIARDERACKLCRPLDKARAPMIGGTFPGGIGGPPRHTRCRCTTGLVEK
jgi:hypothetical protein